MKTFSREKNEERLLKKAELITDNRVYTKEGIVGIKLADFPEFADAKITSLAADGALGNTAKSIKSYLVQLWAKLTAHTGLTTTAHGGIAPLASPVFTTPIRLKGYTVATLPAGTQGDIAFVTDALAPAFLAIIVGGGAVVSPVFHNGVNWVGH